MICVAWRDSKGKKRWCALKPGEKLDPLAWQDATLCRHFIIGRIDSGHTEPDCPECLATLRGTSASTPSEPPADIQTK